MVFLRAALCGGVVLLLSVALHGEPAAEPLAAPKKVVLCDLERARKHHSFGSPSRRTRRLSRQ